jgi:hypothetical protein
MFNEYERIIIEYFELISNKRLTLDWKYKINKTNETFKIT